MKRMQVPPLDLSVPQSIEIFAGRAHFRRGMARAEPQGRREIAKKWIIVSISAPQFTDRGGRLGAR